MIRKHLADLFVALVCAASVIFIITVVRRSMQPAQPPPTTVKFKILIVDQSGISVHATLEVEREDVAVLISGEKWRFQPRMEEE